MKKLALVALVASMLAGCAPSYVRNDVNTLSDAELCSRLGYAQIVADAKAFRGGYAEINRREVEKLLTISLPDCKMYAAMGAMEARKDEESKRDAMIGANQALIRQQAESQRQLQALQNQRPTSTTCNAYGNTVNCTSF